MMSGSRIALAAIGGYVVGRSRKLRRVALLGGIVWSGKALAGGQSELINKTTKALGASTDLKDVADVRGRLVEAGKAAVVTAAGNKINSVSDSLHAKAESLGNDTEERPSASSQESDGDRGHNEEPEGETKPAKRTKSAGGRPSSSGGQSQRSSKSSKASEGSGSRNRTSGSSDRGTRSRKAASGSSKKSSA